MRHLLLVSTLFLGLNQLIAQEVSGKVADKSEVIYGANVVLLNSDNQVVKGTRTDFDGQFTLAAEAGKYTLRVSASGLTEQLFAIELESSKKQNLDVILESPIQDQQEMVVVGIRTKTSDQMLLEEIKTDLGLKSSVSAEQISSSGAGDTKEVLAKMSGVSASKSSGTIFVRGLGDRYNSAYLNGLPLVSSNPELRVMPMDIIPTSIIEVLDVSKMMAPNLYGDFAGGAINIRTKKVFKTPSLKFTVGTSSNTLSTGKAFTSYAGGKFDYFGYDDGTRSIPVSIKETSLKRADNIFKEGLYNSNDGSGNNGFSKNFNLVKKTALPGTNFKFEAGNYYASKKEGAMDRGFGFVAMLSHSVNYQMKNGSSRYINAQNKLEYNFDTQSESFNTSSVGLLSFVGDFSKYHQINLNYLYINNLEDNTTQSWGYHRDFSDDGSEMYGRRNTFNQNNIQIAQLLGEHTFKADSKIKVNWAGSYSLTNNLIPDRKQITGLYTDRNDTEHYSLLALDANQTHRFFSTLNENEIAAHADLTWSLMEEKAGDTVNKKLELLVGVDQKLKARTFAFRQFNYLAKPLADKYSQQFNINEPDNYLNDENHRLGLYHIEESANPGNGYEATQNITGVNAGVLYQVNRKLEFIPNLRVEKGFQMVSNRKQTQANIKEINIIDGIDFMPSLTMKLETRKNQQLRFGASKTIIRPKFFEVAPFEYLAQVIGMVQVGNKNLTNATNYNADLRYEIFAPKGSDFLVAGLFGKKLINPIEQVQLPSASGQIISFDNTSDAVVAGGELEFSKNLARLGKTFWKDLSIGGNLAYVFSQIDVNDKTGFTTNNIRPLQGASPILANIMLKYDKTFMKTVGEERLKGISMSSALSLSYTSKTLFAVGIQGIGDQYVFPMLQLNFTHKMDLSERLSLSLVCRNLLNTSYKLYQQDMVTTGEWQLVNAYKTGIDFQFKVTYAFNKKK